MSEAEVSIAHVVFDPAHEASVARRRTLFVLAVVTSLMAHLLLLVATRRADPSLEQWSAELAVVIHGELAEQAPFQLAEPDPPPLPAEEPAPPPSAVAPQPRPAPSRTAVARSAEADTPSEPPAPAAAADVIAAEPAPGAPVDLTGNTFITGEASAYAGGATATDGTSSTRVDPAPRQPTQPAEPAEPAGPDLSRPVRPLARAWNCRWPDAALDEQIYEQVVLIRVTVAADGSLARTRVLRDPGHGFGAAARACAAQHRYEPARGRDGQPRLSESAPIRVRFRR